MTKRMLVDATHPEETRVAIVDERRLEDFDFESASKKQLKGNIYLAKVIRIEPSLQAAFVEYGGNRHGFLPFGEIHPDYFRIPMADRPHDEVEEEEESGEDEVEISPEAYAEEMSAYQNEALEHEDEHGHIQEESSEAPAPEAPVAPAASETPPTFAGEDIVSVPPVAQATPAPEQQTSTGLGAEADADLGLITDFGNAVVEPVFVPTPVETVGGHGAEAEEIEERPRRARLPRYKIQEVVKRRQIMLIQVVKEERGNKGAALTTFLSLAGRYCVLMPNTDRGGGVSRKITSHQDRRRMKEILDKLETPEGMAVILRTAGMEQETGEIQRDLEHLLRLWNSIREQTLVSTAPTLIYEEANLIKRSIRDLYAPEVAEILVAGAKGFELAHEFMRSIMPEDAEKVKLYEDSVPLFFRYNPVVQLRSGGYIVINPTEALVSIDVNSGRATRERHIEGTALKTNLEAAEEVARQLRLRDLAGLIVIDFIDMEDGRNNAAVERRMKEAMKSDRARLQIGRLSAFGLMELSRQRLHPSLTEINFEKCPHCAGTGMIRSVDSSAISILRQIEEEALRQPGGEMTLHVPSNVALYILNQKRAQLHGIEERYGVQVLLHSDDTLVPPNSRLERAKTGNGESKVRAPAVDSDQVFADAPASEDVRPAESADYQPAPRPEGERERAPRRGRGRFGRGRDRGDRNRAPYAQPVQDQQPQVDPSGNAISTLTQPDDNIGNTYVPGVATEGAPSDASYGENRQEDPRRQGRRRGRRGGRNRHNGPRDNRDDFRPNNRNEARPNYGGEPQNPYVAPPVVIPASVHELDTTPRDPHAQAPVSTPPTRMPPAQPNKPVKFAPPPSPYEVTNPETDKPKGGWWKKLTGQ